MFYYVYYVSEFPKIENAYRKRVVLFLLTDTHSATERQMVKMCVCVRAFAGWQCWPGWLCFWVGVLSAWRRPQWWWVFKQRLAERKTTALRKRTSSTEYRHLCVNECVSARFAEAFVSSQSSVNVTLSFQRSHQPRCSHLLSAYEREREE